MAQKENSVDITDMRDFDIREMVKLIPLCTKDGRKANWIGYHFNPVDKNFPHCIIIDKNAMTCSYSDKGVCMQHPDDPDWNLMLVDDPIDFDAWVDKTSVMAEVLPDDLKYAYSDLGLTGEAGEVADKVKKEWRDKKGEFSESSRKEIAKELSDVLWYTTAMAHELGFTLNDIMRLNKDKIQSRISRGKLHGDGDNR